MQDFRRLVVWRAAHALALDVYRVTERFPAAERYALASQLRRSSVSIAANISEGCGRGTRADLVRFLFIASGSASELDYELQLSRDLALLDETASARLHASLLHVRKMLTSLIRLLRRSPFRPRTKNQEPNQ